MTEKSARSVPQTKRQMPRALAVEPGPLNAVKLELGIAIIVLFSLLVGVETWVDDIFIQLGILAITASIVTIWLIVRTRRVLANVEAMHESMHTKQHERTEETQRELSNGQE